MTLPASEIPTTTLAPLESPSQDPEFVTDDASEAGNEPRNFVVMAAFLIVQRLGWIFKTESIIMPAVADLVGAGGWLRGCLPVLSRIGLSVPPLFASRRVKTTPRKQSILFVTSACMSLTFLSLALMWTAREAIGAAWMAFAFLALYTLFFTAVGVNQLVLGTLTGKLIQVTHRGRLLLVANVLGATIAITAAVVLMPRWLESGGYVYIFGFAGLMFGLNAMMSLMLVESPDDETAPRQSPSELFRSAYRLLREDRTFRRAACIGALFGSSFTLFPHYQAIALGQMGLDHTDMMMWVVLQNVGTALLSMLVGPVADRRGNRAVLRGILLAVLLAPLLAITLPHFANGAAWFPLVFLLVGTTPVTVRILHNYILEVAPTADHPLYLSTLSLVVGMPVLLSPVIGLIVVRFGFEVVFIPVACLGLVAWLLSWRIDEPRHA